jgi:hypothetical protein
LAGVKVSGKIGGKNMVAALYSRDEFSEWDQLGGDADFGIFRYKRALGGNDSYIGGFYTGKERTNGYNRVLGVDGSVRTSPSSKLSYYAFGSQTVNESLDPRDDGHAVGVDYKINNRNWDLELAGLDIAKEFRTEVGYMNRTGVSRARAYVGPKFYPSSGFFQRIDTSALTEHTEDKFSGLWESYNWLSLGFLLPRSSNVTFRYNYGSEVFGAQEFDTNGIHASGRSQITRWLFLQISYTQGGAIFYSENPYQGDSRRVTGLLRFQPSDQIEARVDYTYSNFFRRSDSKKIYDYAITRGFLTYQLNKYLFFRGIVEHNAFYDSLTTDFLASFTYIPGTVIHLGYGSLYEQIIWRDGEYRPYDHFRESRRGLFFKASYLWRM